MEYPGEPLDVAALMALWDPTAWPYANVTPLRPSPDRIDPSCGYVEGNVRWVPWLLNAAMSGGYSLEMVVGRLRKMGGVHVAA
jgi:hypothetical protein